MIEIPVDVGFTWPEAGIPGLDNALRTQFNALYRGLRTQKGIIIALLENNATPDQQAQVRTAVMAHDFTVRTPDQLEQTADKTDVDALLAQIATALTDIASKRAAFNGTPNIANAGILLNELAQDMTGVLKALRYILKHR